MCKINADIVKEAKMDGRQTPLNTTEIIQGRMLPCFVETKHMQTYRNALK